MNQVEEAIEMLRTVPGADSTVLNYRMRASINGRPANLDTRHERPAQIGLYRGDHITLPNMIYQYDTNSGHAVYMDADGAGETAVRLLLMKHVYEQVVGRTALDFVGPEGAVKHHIAGNEVRVSSAGFHITTPEGPEVLPLALWMPRPDVTKPEPMGLEALAATASNAFAQLFARA